MNDKSLEQFLFEEIDHRGSVDMRSTDHNDSHNTTGATSDSFRSIKGDLGSYERMQAILAGEEKFEYNILNNQSMVRALVDQVKTMIKNKDNLKEQDKSVANRIKKLETISYKRPEQVDELAQLNNSKKTYQLKKTLFRFDKRLDELDDILKRIEDGVDITDKTIKKYDEIVGDIEDTLFNETYVRRNLGYVRGEASSSQRKPTADSNFPIKYISYNNRIYYGIVRPPSGMITWEGREAREMWLSDPAVRSIYTNNKRSRDELLKIRIDKSSFKVLSKEMLNDKLFKLRTTDGKNAVRVNDSQQAKDAINTFIFNLNDNGGEREVEDYSVYGDRKLKPNKTIKPGFDGSGRPKDLTQAIDSIEFWKVIRNLL